MFRRRPQSRARITQLLLALACALGARAAAAEVDRGLEKKGETASSVPTFRLEAAGGVGWVRGTWDTQSQSLNEVRGEASYLGFDALVLGVHGLYQVGERSFAMTAPFSTQAGATRVLEREQRVVLGTTFGWDPLRSWAVPSRRRAGFLLIPMALDVDQFINRVAPVVGFEPGAGARGYVRLVGPVTLKAGGTYQWITNFSSRASDARVVRARPLGTLRYDAALAFTLARFATLEARYAGEAINFMHERTLGHSFLFGVSFDV